MSDRPQDDNPTPIFKKCDLHVHSSSCYSRNYIKEEFFDALLESDLDVIAITDHNYVDTQLLKELKERLDRVNKTLMPGVELNVYIPEDMVDNYELTLAKADKADYFHAIVLCDFENIDSLHQDIEDLFKNLDPQMQARQNENGRAITKKRADIACELSSVTDKLEDIPHFFIFHEGKGDRNLSDYLPERIDGKECPNNQFFKEKLFYYYTGMAIEGGSKTQEIGNYFDETLDTIVASLLFSDAENLDDIGKKFSWIDFNGDLETLNLAVSDPESRIKTSDIYQDNPQTNEHQYLEAIKFEVQQKEGSKLVELEFAPNYNGIIGARGSGKSMLASILTKENTGNYDNFLLADTTQFKFVGENYTRDCPKHLYLRQGEFEDLYRKGDYTDIPFLKEIIEPMEEEAKVKNQKQVQVAENLIEVLKKNVLSYIQQYPQFVHLDFLGKPKPEGNPIEKPLSKKDEAACIEEAKKTLRKLSEACEQISEEQISLEYEGTITLEMHPIFEALDIYLKQIENGISRFKAINETVLEQVENLDLTICTTRTKLREALVNGINSANATYDNVLVRYDTNEKYALDFFENLLELRIKIKDFEETIGQILTKTAAPVDPKEKHLSETETLKIEVLFNADQSYENFVQSQFRSGYSSLSETLAKLCLMTTDTKRCQELFNGTQYKAKELSKPADYIEKLCLKLTEFVKGFADPKTVIFSNATRLEDMSPGGRAQILLKLFLHQSITAADYKFIVLDQPEDNLDTETIVSTLVDLIKRYKTKIQFFVVSHSAPVIVNGDARTVIVCEANDNYINYQYGEICTPQIKQKTAKVLDGGEKYLKMRLNKYNFQIGDHND